MRRSISIRNANLLYLITFVALLVGSVVLSGVSLGWRILINEVAFLGLPLAITLLITRPDLRGSLRLRGVSWQIAGLSLLVGRGLWRFDSWLAVVINGLLDYTIPLPPEALNVTVLDNFAIALGTVVLAPVVEEFLFSDVIQSAYERRGPVRAIAGSTVLFVMIHQELARPQLAGQELADHSRRADLLGRPRRGGALWRPSRGAGSRVARGAWISSVGEGGALDVRDSECTRRACRRSRMLLDAGPGVIPA